MTFLGSKSSFVTSTKRQLISFLLVGCLNTFFGYATFAFFLYLGVSYPFALLIATFFGIFFNFKTIGSFVFRDDNFKRLYRFICVYTFTCILNITLINFLVTVIANTYIAGFCVLAPMAIITFLLNKFFVFGVMHEIN